jgi:DNA-binding NarL/FixJ family response regulator
MNLPHPTDPQPLHPTMSSKQMTADTTINRVKLQDRSTPLKITVSIVEDDAEMRQILGNWLKQSPDFQLLSEFGNAEAALERIPADKPAVVLMDINLPGISGVDCVGRLKPLLPNTQFVMLTVYEDANHIFAALAAGASGYLLKQTPGHDLLESIKDVYNGGSPMTSNIARKVVQSFQTPKPKTDPSEELSPREKEVLDLVTRGFLFKEIADKLGIGIPTVNTYIRRIYEKLHVRSRSQAIAKVTRLVN